MIALAFWVAYSGLALVAVTNLALMPRRPAPSKGRQPQKFDVLIPARNEAANLGPLLIAIRAHVADCKIYVFDDESEDDTAKIAAEHRATVLKPLEPLPAGWTGKNRACHELAKAAIEDSDRNWMVFMDADALPTEGFGPIMEAWAGALPSNVGVLSGFPTLVAGRFPQALCLVWVPWILLATNPFGLVAATGLGHNRFTNGQITLWRKSVYAQLWPNEALKGAILEDVKIGRLLAKAGIGLRVVNLTSILKVKMYDTWAETMDGMSKNAYEIADSQWGTWALALFFMALGWGWLAAGRNMGPQLGLLSFGVLCTSLATRSRLWPALLAPIACTVAAVSLVRSSIWRKKGIVTWKGRVYTSNPSQTAPKQ